MIDRKTAQKIMNKVIDAGYRDEKTILSLTTEKIVEIKGITVPEIVLILELQKAIKGNKVVSFLAGDGEDNGQ